MRHGYKATKIRRSFSDWGRTCQHLSGWSAFQKFRRTKVHNLCERRAILPHKLHFQCLEGAPEVRDIDRQPEPPILRLRFRMTAYLEYEIQTENASYSFSVTAIFRASPPSDVITISPVASFLMLLNLSPHSTSTSASGVSSSSSPRVSSWRSPSSR